MTSPFEISIDSSWVNEHIDGFDRCVVLKYVGPEYIGEDFRAHVSDRLLTDIGLRHERDYIFTGSFGPRSETDQLKNALIDDIDSRWFQDIDMALSGSIDISFMLRLRKDEHFTMMVLHYNN